MYYFGLFLFTGVLLSSSTSYDFMDWWNRDGYRQRVVGQVTVLILT
jgi:hypothetical protein